MQNNSPAASSLAWVSPALMAMHLDRNWTLPPHLALLNDALIDLAHGVIDRLMVFMPPRHGKSELCSCYFPIWYLHTFPDHRVMLCGYGDSFAREWGGRVRDGIEKAGQMKVTDISIRPDATAANRWKLQNHRGGMMTAGIGGAITGFGANILIIDDPVKSRAEAESATYRRRVVQWLKNDAETRLEPGGKELLIQTRWHSDDLAGHILAEDSGKRWKVISLPAIAEEGDAMGRVPGEALWPHRFPTSRLDEIRTSLGSYGFNALYQQRPSAENGNVFRFEWWQMFDELPPGDPIRVVQSWDTAFKKGTENDESVCTTWAQFKSGFYLLDVFSDRLEYPALKATMKLKASLFNPGVILVEDKASGQSLIQEMKLESSLPIIPIRVDVDKVSRAHAATPLIEAGHVHIRDGASWTRKFIDQMTAFPNDTHDDIVDSVTQFINWTRGQSSSGIARIFTGENRERVSADRHPTEGVEDFSTQPFRSESSEDMMRGF